MKGLRRTFRCRANIELARISKVVNGGYNGLTDRQNRWLHAELIVGRIDLFPAPGFWIDPTPI